MPIVNFIPILTAIKEGNIVIQENSNAFSVLKVTTYATKNEILEACETRSFEIDPDLAEEAQAKLLNPKQRLHEFLRWFCDCSKFEQEELLNGNEIDMDDAPFSRCNLLLSQITSLSDTDKICDCIFEFDSVWNDYDEVDVLNLLESQHEANQLGLPSLGDIKQELYEYLKECASHVSEALSTIDESKFRRILTEVLDTCDFTDGIASDIVKKCFDTYELTVKQKVDTILNEISSSVNTGKYDCLFSTGNLVSEPIIDYFTTLAPLQNFNEKCLKSETVYNFMLTVILKGIDNLMDNKHCDAAMTFINSLLNINAVSECPQLVSIFNRELSNIAKVKKYEGITNFLDDWLKLLNGYTQDNANTSYTLLSFLQSRIPSIKKDIPTLPISLNLPACQKSNKLGDVFFLSVRTFAIQVANDEHDYDRALMVLSLLDSCYSTASWCHHTIMNDKNILNHNIINKEQQKKMNRNDTIMSFFSIPGVPILIVVGIIWLIGTIGGAF